MINDNSQGVVFIFLSATCCPVDHPASGGKSERSRPTVSDGESSPEPIDLQNDSNDEHRQSATTCGGNETRKRAIDVGTTATDRI